MSYTSNLQKPVPVGQSRSSKDEIVQLIHPGSCYIMSENTGSFYTHQIPISQSGQRLSLTIGMKDGKYHIIRQSVITAPQLSINPHS